MRVLISGGGTGGHVNPAIAIANYLREKNADTIIAFAGTEKGIENKLVPKEGYKLYYLEVKGFKRKLSLENFDALIKAFTSQWAAKKIIKDFKPDIVIGTGGYVSWPVLASAAKQKIPTVIHESNAYPGVTTKMLAKVVDKVMISFEECGKYFNKINKNDLVYTGNPVKREFFNLDYNAAKQELSPDKPMILSYGGSTGAEKINQVIIDFMEKYSKNKNITHYHATGAGGAGRIGFKEYQEIFKNRKLNEYKNLHLNEYFYNIQKYMAAADLIICRSGALTLAELAVIKKPAILIPSPYVTENHQFRNAAVLEQAGAAVIVEEKDLTAEKLIEKMNEIMAESSKIAEMSKNISKFAQVEALENIYKVVEELTKN